MDQQKIENLGKWHLSKYNIFSTEETEDKKLPCVNLFKGTYSELDLEDIRRLYHLEDIENIEQKMKKFIRQGIIVNFDEKEYIKSFLLLNYNKKKLTIFIAPTLACNFNCPYCFEDHKNKNKMNKNIQNKVIDFIEKTIYSSNKKEIDIIWYGGEPLLCPEIIEYISDSIFSFCEKKEIKYSARIITNGYLFKQENVDILNKYKINRAQITLDGLKENHDYSRCLKNGEGSFDIIINNLATVKYNGVINIRNNINDKNKNDINELKKIIKKISKESNNKINYNSAPIINNPGEKREKQINFLNIKDSINFELKRAGNKIPNFRTNYCSVNSLFFFGIGPNGELYKCLEDFGYKERSYGNIESWNINDPLKTASNLDVLMKYLNGAGILDKECENCIWLPICGGGCLSKKFFCDMKCLPYVPYKYDQDFFIQKIKEFSNN